MDVLADICSRLRLQAGVYFRACLAAPFAVGLPKEARHIRFHLVLAGSAFVSRAGEAPLRLREGDLALVPEGAAQVLSSGVEPGSGVPLSEVLARHPVADGVLTTGEGRCDVELLCGYLRFEEALHHPAFACLPPVLVLNREDPGCGPALSLLVGEARRADPGGSFVLHRVIEILLVQCLREVWTGQDQDQDQGQRVAFVAALRDSRLARALEAIHAQPHLDWTLERLARHSGLSRSVLSQRFRAAAGMGPIAYLALWRMTLARDLLDQDRLDMSVPAFTRRFTAMLGMGPGAWRRRARDGDITTPSR